MPFSFSNLTATSRLPNNRSAANRSFISKLTEPLIRRVAAQIREDFGLKRCTSKDVSAAEVRLVWILHGGLHYSAVRKQIYGMPGVPDTELRALVEHGVDSLLAGMKLLFEQKGLIMPDVRVSPMTGRSSRQISTHFPKQTRDQRK